MTFILAVSGKKQSGKSTLVDFLVEWFENEGLIVKAYSFADSLKEFLVNAMGLRPEQVYGTDAEKNSLTDYRWETLPLKVRWQNSGKPAETFLRAHEGNYAMHPGGKEMAWAAFVKSHWQTISKDLRTGPMSGREMMQVFGTDIMREMFDDRIWVNATFRSICKDDPDIALIPDLRFPSEIRGLEENDGYIIRLTRDVSGGDPHPSETALDDFDWDKISHQDGMARVVPAEASIEDVRAAALNFITWLGYSKPEAFEKSGAMAEEEGQR
tara:strand:+ start:425065 stop:425871 length:807 start_codon:yes stop_codon:yes gene_type:complete